MTDVAHDADGNLYVTGNFGGGNIVDLDPGSSTFSMSYFPNGGKKTIFLASYDSTGSFRWAQRIGGRDATLPTYGYYAYLDVTNDGRVFISGHMFGKFYFDLNDTNVTRYTSTGPDLYVATYDNNGGFIDAKIIGGDAEVTIGNVETGNRKSVFLGGSAGGGSSGPNATDFDPDSGMVIYKSSFGNPFILKLDSNLNYQWVSLFEGGPPAPSTNKNLIEDTKFDPSTGELFVTGLFTTYLDLDPDTNITINFLSKGVNDAFLARLDSSGHYISGNVLASSESEIIHSIDIDSAGFLFIGGLFEDSLDFDLDPVNVEFRIGKSNGDPFLAKYDKNFNLIFVNHYPETLAGYVLEIEAFSNKMFFTGVVSDTLDLNPDSGTYYLLSNGYYDVMLVRTDGCKSYISQSSASICQGDTFLFPSGNLATNPGIDSFLLVTFDGCDSLILTELTVNSKYSFSDSTSICSGSSFQFPDGTSTNVPKTHKSYLISKSGCDSNITITVDTNGIETSIIQNGNTLTSKAINIKYQWLNCDSGYTRVIGETGREYIATMNGKYAVLVSDSICSDTSLCLEVTGVGILNPSKVPGIIVYPNPSDGFVNIVVQQPDFQGIVNITNSFGSVIAEIDLKSGKNTVDLSSYSPGIYFLLIFGDTEKFPHQKLILK
ncbi:MAG: T9SS type A sorting domain-containing protein [Vicingaceae bacterium]